MLETNVIPSHSARLYGLRSERSTVRTLGIGAEDLFDNLEELIFLSAMSASENAALLRVVRVIRSIADETLIE